jgi:PKD repeat protein
MTEEHICIDYGGTMTNFKQALLAIALIALLVVPASASIYGVTWNQSNSSPSAFSNYWGANYAPIAKPDFNATEPWMSMGRVNNSATKYQTMVQVKKHYYRTENVILTGGIHWMNFSISDVPATGYSTDPWHVVNGTEVPVVYLGAFEGSIQFANGTYNTGDFTANPATDKLSSVPGSKPASGVNWPASLPNFRLTAENRGTGYELQSFASMSVVERMYIIEYRNWDSQSVIGTGVTQITDDGLTNMAIPTGLTAGYGVNSTNCGNFTCSVTTVHYQTHQITYQISYRGLEAWYGNVWKWTDFINIQADHKPWTADHSPQSDVFSGSYTFSGVTLPAANGYIRNLAYASGFDYGFLPSEVTSSSSTYLCDYYYMAAGNRSALIGGSWSRGEIAGFASWGLDGAASLVARNIGARVALTPPLYANFTYNNSKRNVAFTDTSYNISIKTGLITQPTSWNWSFGDGNVSSLQNPTEPYLSGGTFAVNLTVSDGTNYATSYQTVKAPGSILAPFTPTNINTYPNTAITFTDTSTGSPTSWDWNWGDGTHCYSQNCTKWWYGSGVYNVSLNASTSTGFSTNYTIVSVLSGYI